MISGPSKKSNLIKIGQYMEKFTFMREGGGERGPLSKISISIIIGKHMKTLCLKFHQDRAINEEFYFWGGGQNSFWGSQGRQSGPISKIQKILIQNGGLNPQPKFQHSS